MELVYLWVEDYKNIHKQGFNFSSKFICDYDGGTLTIDDNPDHIENFFGENINVTAIVGKNGSGKSSVFEVLAFLYWQGVTPLIKEDDKTFFLYKSNGRFYIQCENYKIHHTKGFQKLFKNIDNNTKVSSPTSFSHRTSMPLISFSNCISDMIHNKSLEKLKSYDNFYNGIQPDNPMMKSKGFYDNFNQKFHDILKKEKDFFNFVDKNLLFNNFKIEIHIYELGAWFIGDELYEKFIISEDSGDLLSFGQTEQGTNNTLYKAFALFLISKSRGIRRYDDLGQRSNEEDEQYLKANIFDKVKELFENESFGEKEYKKVLDICLEALNPSFNNLENEVRNSFLYKDYDLEIVKKIIEKYTFNEANIFTSNIYNIDEFKIESVIDTSLEKELLSEKLLRINFFKNSNKNHSFLNLSSGEKLYLNILTNFAYTLYHLEDDYNGIMLFDEIELSFHPAWQKQIIGHLLYMYNKVRESKKIDLHLIFTTHSPFLLSDIPKQNIIFLDKDEAGKCKVVDGLKDKKQTFGANIHTLLSDSFFMEDGLMGEFAKGKIDKAIALLNKDKLDEKELKYCEEIISIIGEPIVKNQLQRMLDSKRLSKIDDINAKIKQMSYELGVLKEHQSQIAQDELRDKGKQRYKERFIDDKNN